MLTKSSAPLAMVTPWPPQRSGIADYALTLVEAMRSAGATIDVFTNADGAADVEHIQSVEHALRELEHYPRVLFQVGNHPFFHGYMLPLISAIGRSRCVVELHDFRLSHLLSGLNYHEDPEFERRWLSSNYGQVVETVDDAHPVSDLVCNLASDVFVHSNFVRTRLRQLGLSHVHVVDLAYDLSALGLGPGGTRSKGDAVRIGIFGTFQKNRQIPLVIGALGLLRRHGVTGWKLVLGGRRSHDFDEILAAIEACGIGAHIELHEDVAGEDFISLIKNVDVHVALRNPTYGETSGVVVQGLASGVPTIVSDVGWYSELPDFVAKIPAMGGLLELAKTLRTFIVDPELRAQTGLRTQRFGSTAYDVRRTAEEILSILTHEKNI